jgi:hypothetical protein
MNRAGAFGRDWDKTKNPLFFKSLQSFYEALDCAASNNRLKRGERYVRARADSGLRRNWPSTSGIKSIFLTRTLQAIRARRTFCHRAGLGPAGNWESDERDIRHKI